MAKMQRRTASSVAEAVATVQAEEALWRSGTILDEARDITDVADYLKFLIYGDIGVGKTLLIGTLADAAAREYFEGDVLYIDAEGGKGTIRNKRGLRYLKITNWQSLQRIYEGLYKQFDMGRDRWQGPWYGAVAVDSFTELEGRMRVQVTREAAAKNPKEDPEVTSQREWGRVQERIQNMVRAYKDLPIHYFAVFLEKLDTDEKTGLVKIRPDVPGKLAGRVAAHFDVVGRMYIEDVDYVVQEDGKDKKRTRPERRMLFRQTARYVAKDRFNVLGEVMREPTMAKIMKLIADSREAA
jgi:hypothetical protein